MKLPSILSPLILFPFKCQGTYTIISYDKETGNVGGSGTTCITGDGAQVSITYASAPNIGVVAAQSLINATARDIAIQKIKNGQDPSTIISEFQINANIADEQYGIINSKETKGFTGSSCMDWAGDIQGSINGFEYSFQGNILTSDMVGSQASAAFTQERTNIFHNDTLTNDKIKTRGCEMAWRLFNAVQAGGENNQGDSRCSGRAGATSFLRVDLSQDSGVFFTDTPGGTSCFSPSFDDNIPGFMKGMLSFFKSPTNCDFEQRGYSDAFLSIEVGADGDLDPLVELGERFRSWANLNDCWED